MVPHDTLGLEQKPPGHKPPDKSPLDKGTMDISHRTKAPDKKPPNNEKYKLFIYWYLCTHFGLIVLLFMG
jgi:hypothetical protein